MSSALLDFRAGIPCGRPILELDAKGFYCLCVTGLVEVAGEEVFERQDGYPLAAMIFWINDVVRAALTLYCATSILPFSSTTKVERMTP